MLSGIQSSQANESSSGSGGLSGDLATNPVLLDPAVADFLTRYPIDENATRYLTNSPPDVIEMAMRDFKPPREGDDDYSAILTSFVKRLRSTMASQANESNSSMASQEALDAFLKRYPVDQDAYNYLMGSSPGVQARVCREFKPKREGEADYSAIVLTFAKRCRDDERSRGPAAVPMHGSFSGGAPSQYQLDQLLQRYPMDERAYNYLLESAPAVQQQVLREFKPPREGESDYSAIFISFVKRCRGPGGLSAQQLHHQQQAQQHRAPNIYERAMQHAYEVEAQQRAPSIYERAMQHAYEVEAGYGHQASRSNPVSGGLHGPGGSFQGGGGGLMAGRGSGGGGGGYGGQRFGGGSGYGGNAAAFHGGGGGVQAVMPSMDEIEHFREKYPMDDNAFRYLTNSPADVIDCVLKTYQAPVNENTDHSAPVTAYAKKLRAASSENYGPARASFGGGPSDWEVQQFCDRYPMDQRAYDNLTSCSPDVLSRVLREFRAKVEGESDYSALISAFVKRCRDRPGPY
eukprot:gnl/TRDRNA2_/TRDRNA2_159594_c0_seq1.p1 gnl/TRDRNA2_/TRDRNA2_159594_c0~~gnl/TRDRNA2_/TRDRNA2_159594_c0_seq1.p1  ORF type:complete len:517 (+),score=94.36 gnl/TRDRNA2_/TRDRNA2_159594_c0_seq1:57-1607(+)